MAQASRPPLELSALLFDFLFGGLLVAGAVAVANLAGGLFAGVMAALPIRLAVSMVFIPGGTSGPPWPSPPWPAGGRRPWGTWCSGPWRDLSG